LKLDFQKFKQNFGGGGSAPTFRKPFATAVIKLKERSFMMLKKDLILRNPLRLMGQESEEIIPPGGCGAVLARAGVGKTALMIQLALNTLLSGKNVLHVSLNDPVDKVTLWYREVFSRLAQQYNISEINRLWDTILPHRFIMTFKIEGFSVPKLEERLTDLTEQGIYRPHMVLIDGLPFDGPNRDALEALKRLTQKYEMQTWLSVKTHRHEMPDSDGMPPQLFNVDDLFEVIIQLQPEGQDVYIRALKGGAQDGEVHELLLDPATMLIMGAK
jgi:hypothetical protein